MPYIQNYIYNKIFYTEQKRGLVVTENVNNLKVFWSKNHGLLIPLQIDREISLFYLLFVLGGFPPNSKLLFYNLKLYFVKIILIMQYLERKEIPR